MNGTMKKFLAATITIVASIATNAYAENPTVICPTLTANDVENIISNGYIGTKQDYTLADEAGLPRAQVIVEEPTANPFDNFYHMGVMKEVNHQHFAIYIGNVLGKTSSEAKERARKILGDEKTFDAKYDPKNRACMYKEINASPSLANYPFKTTYETVALTAYFYDNSEEDSANLMRHFKMKKHRA